MVFDDTFATEKEMTLWAAGGGFACGVVEATGAGQGSHLGKRDGVWLGWDGGLEEGNEFVEDSSSGADAGGGDEAD